MFTSVLNLSRCSVARLCVRSQSALDAFYNVVQAFATSSLSMLTPAIWSRAWAGVAKRTRGGCPRREELSTSVRNMSRCSVACLCMCCHRKRQVLLQYTPGPAPKLITSLGKSVRRSKVRDPPAESRCREQYSVHALQRFGRMCEATGPARYGLDEPFDDWASRLPCSHSGHSAGISFATSSDVSSDLQQEA